MNRKQADIPLLRTFLPVMALAGTFVLGSATVHAVQKYQYPSQLCTDCHGMPPIDAAYRNVTTGGFKGSHLTHATSVQSSCEKCHNGSSVFTSEHSDGFIHMSSNVNASPVRAVYGSKGVFFNQTSNPVLGTCTNVNCHFEKETPAWSASPFASPGDCGQCHGTPPAGSAGAPGSAGSHATHDSYYTGASQCIKCHTDHTADAKPFAHATSLRNIIVTPRDPSNVAGGSYSGSGASFLPSQSGSQSFGTCSNLYCHSQGKSTTIFTGAGNAPKVTPIWGATPPLAANCAGCHGGTVAAGFNAMTSGKHPHHIIAAAKGYSFTCNYCHFDTTSDGTTITDRTKHVNGSKDVAFGTPAIRVSTSTWNGTQCVNVYCHGNGQSLTPTDTIAWTDSIGDCTGCHSHTTIASGSHVKHVNSDHNSCTKCHNATVSGLTIVDYTKHVNRSLDIKLSTGLSEISPKYNDTAISADYQKTPGTAYARCSGLYCHSDGKRNAAYRTYSSKLWGSASLGCNGCHGTSNSSGAPGYTSGTGYENSHAKHAGGSSDCVKCHFRTTADGTSVIGGTLSHVDGTIKVNLSKVSAFTTYSGIYDSSTKTCSSTYCHGGSSTSPSWGGSTTCTTCHKADSNLPGAHSLHIQGGAPAATSYTTSPGNASSATSYQFTCASCHGNNVSNHGNGPVASGSDATIFFGFSSAGRNPSYSRTGTSTTDAQGFKWMQGAAGACGSTYCHSNGAGGNGINTTFTWASASGSIGCKGCHDGAGATTTLSGRHLKHIGTSAYNFACNYCHYDTTNNGSTVTGKNLHVNKIKDVSFDPQIRTTASTSTWDGTQCANVYCHGNGQSFKSTDTVPANWTVSTDCWSCHAYPNLVSGSHAKHVVNSSSCSICHNDTVASGINYSLHNNRYVDIRLKVPAVAETTPTYNGANIATANYQKTPGTTTATCTNLYCHSDGTWVWLGGSYTNTTPQWGNAGSTTCYSCHYNTKSYYTGTDWRKAFPLYSSYPDSATRKTNSHQHHADVRGTNSGPQCRHCHYKVVSAAANNATTDTTTAPTGTTRHANGFYNISGSGSNVQYDRGDDSTFVSGGTPANVTFNYTYNAKPSASTCSSVSCHPSALSGTPNVAWNNRHDCSNCHKVDLKDTSGYHHAMNNYSTGNLTYPANAPTGNADGTGGATYSTNRRCTMCHVNHDIFSPMLNPNSANRSYNLRTAIGTPPTVASGFTNTDFVQKNGVGGICVSCHTNALTKSSVYRKPENSVGTPTTLAIVYADYSAAIVNGHNYAISSAMKNDGGSFSANCSKCHNGRKGETGVFSQMTTAVHDNTNRFMFASLQADYTQGLYIANLCMRCHHNSTDAGSPGGGTKKARANYDYYGNQAMNSASQSVWNLFSSGRNKAWNAVGTSNRFGHNVLFTGYTSHIPSYTQENGADIASHKHVTCTDCHNPHGTRRGNHTAGNTALATVLKGTDGVSVTWSAASTWPATSNATFKAITSVTREYQICFKCHSGYNTNVTNWATTGSAAPTGAQAWTDLGLEFNPNNKSAHPVVVSLNNQTGSSTPNALNANQMIAPWTSVGTQVMTCSDCHGTDSTASKGPHGSAVKWMLVGTYKNWPYTASSANGSSSGTFLTLESQTTNSGYTNKDFCMNCHEIGTQYGHMGELGSRSDHRAIACVNCHIRVPHGGKVSRLITTDTAGLPGRYKPNGAGGAFSGGRVTQFKKASSSNNYTENNCNQTGCSSHGSITSPETW